MTINTDPVSAAFEDEARNPPPRLVVWNVVGGHTYWLATAWATLFAATLFAFMYIRAALVHLHAAQPSIVVDSLAFWLLCIGSCGLVAAIPLILYAVARPSLMLARFGTAVEVTVSDVEVEVAQVKNLRIAYRLSGVANAPLRRCRVPFAGAARLCPRVRDLKSGDTLIAVAHPHRPDHATLWLSIRMWVDMRE